VRWAFYLPILLVATRYGSSAVGTGVHVEPVEEPT